MLVDDLEPWEYQALAEFRHQIRGFVHFSEHAADDAGLSHQQHQMLLALKGISDGQEPTVGYLADRLHLRHHSAVELVNRLCRGGLVRRQRDSDDRRRIHVRMTRRGESLLRKLSVAHRAELQSVGPALIQTLQRLITRTRNENHSSKTASAKSR